MHGWHCCYWCQEGKWWVSSESYDCLIEVSFIGVVPLVSKDGQMAIMVTLGDGDKCNGVVYEKI